MPANTSPIFPLTPKNFGATFVNADGTAYKALVTAGANGSIVDLLNIISDDTAAMNVVLSLFNGSTDYPLNEIPVPAGSGTNGSAKPINGLNPKDTPSLGNREDRSIYLQSGWSLRAKMKVAVTAAKTVTVAGGYGDY